MCPGLWHLCLWGLPHDWPQDIVHRSDPANHSGYLSMFPGLVAGASTVEGGGAAADSWKRQWLPLDIFFSEGDPRPTSGTFFSREYEGSSSAGSEVTTTDEQMAFPSSHFLEEMLHTGGAAPWPSPGATSYRMYQSVHVLPFASIFTLSTIPVGDCSQVG